MTLPTRARPWATARAVAFAALAAALAGCGTAAGTTSGAGASGSRDGSGVVLRVGDQKGGAQALLDAAGLLDGTGYRLEWSQFTSGPPLLEALNAGAIDVGSTGDTPPIFSAAQGGKLRIVAASRSRPTGSAILVPENSPITTLEQLRGASIAVAKGSSAHYHLLAALTKAKLTFADITPNYLQPADALAAFTTGKVQAWAIWDPFTAIAEQTTKARVLATGEGLIGGLGFVEATPEALADPGKEAALRDYIGRLAKARLWSLSHKEEWAASWAKIAGLPPQAARTSVERAEQKYLPIDDALVATEQTTADAFTAAGLIPRKVDIPAVVDRRYNDVVAAATAS